ncbi:hypothetical protein NKH77_05430 [Streptomyces sp. M19]
MCCDDVEPFASTLVHLRAAGVSLLCDLRGPGLPALPYWGADLGDLPQDGLAAAADAATLPPVPGAVDTVPRPARCRSTGRAGRGRRG